MTKEEIKEYIRSSGKSAQIVVDEVKEMYAEGASMTISELDRRLNPVDIDTDLAFLDNPESKMEKYLREQQEMLDEWHSEQPVAPVEMGAIPDDVLEMYDTMHGQPEKKDGLAVAFGTIMNLLAILIAIVVVGVFVLIMAKTYAPDSVLGQYLDKLIEPLKNYG